MAIKHKAVKAPNEEGLASEWNDEHKIDSDVDFAGHSGVNVGEPIAPADIATKNYVDSIGGVSGSLEKNYISGGAETFNNSNWNNVTGASFSITVAEGGFVFLFTTLESYEPYNFLGGQIRFIRDGTEIIGSPFKSTSDTQRPHSTTINIIDTPGAGTHIYQLQYKSDDTVNNRGNVNRWNFGYFNYVATTPTFGQQVSSFSGVLSDPAEYSISIYGDNAYHDIHKYGTVVASTILSKIDSLIATGDLLTSGGSVGILYRFLFVGDNTGDTFASSAFWGTWGSGSFDTHSWRENVINMVGDTSYSVILQGRVNSSGYTRTAAVRNMNLGVLYLE